LAQAIGQVLEIFGVAAFAALATALCLTWLGQRFLPDGLVSRIVLPGAVAIAYFAGYAVLPRSFASFTPQQGQAWPWLPYLGVVGAAVAMALPQSARFSIRLIALIAISAIAAVVLSPTWPIYGLTRVPVAVFLAIYLLAIGFPLLSLPIAPTDRRTLYFLTVLCALNALTIGAIYSARHAQLAALPAAGLTGISLALLVGPKVHQLALWRVGPLFVALVGGIAWLACVEPDPPKPILLAIPLVSWAIWIPRAIPQLPSAPKGIG
jgi:hypothetical protein